MSRILLVINVLMAMVLWTHVWVFIVDDWEKKIKMPALKNETGKLNKLSAERTVGSSNWNISNKIKWSLVPR